MLSDTDKMQTTGAKKAQSALEYLVTYWWAIMIIAVVLAAMFGLGLFSKPIQPFACLPDPLFYCSNSTMDTGGAIALTFTYSGTQPITITGLACNVTEAAPPKTPSVETTYVNVQSGEQLSLVFQCPTGALPLGQTVPINLWFYYNTSPGGPVQEEQFAEGWAKPDYYNVLWNVTAWRPSSNSVDLLPFSDLTANPTNPSQTITGNKTQWTFVETPTASGWAYGTDYHNHDIYYGFEVTLFPLSPLSLDNAPCSAPYDSHGYTAIGYMNMSGTYTFTVVSDDGTEIFYRKVGTSSWSNVFGGAAWQAEAPTIYTQNVVFSKAEYEFVVDYTDVCDPAGVSVVLISPPPTPLT